MTLLSEVCVRWFASSLWLASAGLWFTALDAEAQQPSRKAIAQGRALFDGVGNCARCHGAGGTGTEEGPSLVDGPWTLSDGSLASLMHVSRHAGIGMRGRDDDPRPMRGPSNLDSAQVRQVAAYVHSISRGKTPKQP